MNLRKRLYALPDETFYAERMFLRELKTEDDLIRALFDFRLPPEQQEMVNPAGFSIGRAYLFPESNVPYLIFERETGTPIGFMQLCRYLGIAEVCTSWSYFLAPEHQGKGYGREAAKLAVRVLKNAAPECEIMLSVEQNNRKAQKLYTDIGFVNTGDYDGDDLIFAYRG